MSRITLKKTENVSRSDSFAMNPKDIIINWDENPRKDYGDDEFQMLKESIRATSEVFNPIMVTPVSENNGWKLAHGFRRMKAVLELIDEGVNIEKVKVMAVYSQEEILINHIVLNNTTKELTPVELADSLRQLSKLMQTDSPADLSRRTGLPYNKVLSLMNFAETAGTVLKNAVQNNEVSFNAAKDIARNAPTIEDQIQTLNTAKETAKSAGKSRVSGTVVAKTMGKEYKITKEVSRLRQLLTESEKDYSSVIDVLDNLNASDGDLMIMLNRKKVFAEA